MTDQKEPRKNTRFLSIESLSDLSDTELLHFQGLVGSAIELLSPDLLRSLPEFDTTTQSKMLMASVFIERCKNIREVYASNLERLAQAVTFVERYSDYMQSQKGDSHTQLHVGLEIAECCVFYYRNSDYSKFDFDYDIVQTKELTQQMVSVSKKMTTELIERFGQTSFNLDTWTARYAPTDKLEILE